jgi:hypothetical protein
MTFLNAIYRNGIWLSVPLFVVSAGLLVFTLIGLVRLGAASHLATLPLLERQPVQFSEAGRVALSLEGPRLSKRFSELTFELVSPDGKSLSGRTAWLHARSSGMSTIKMELLTFTLQAPGQYILRVRNLGAGREEDRGLRIIFSKPHLPQTIGFILGIILSAGLMIGSIVLFILRLVNKGGAS